MSRRPVAQPEKRLLPLALMFAAVSSTASAQHFACTTIHPGDTSARVALQLTGKAENRHQVWFQIFDPVTARFVSKDAYDTILPGWRVCLAAAVPSAAQPTLVHDTTWISWVLIFITLTLVLASPAAKTYLDRRRRILDSMSSFAVAFVREFARPLPRRDLSDRPIAATLRCAPYRGRLDILLAPTQGHSYPNLSDHRKNLSYDIERVLRLVPDQSFLCCEPYQRGNWVVIPFRATPTPPLEEGVK